MLCVLEKYVKRGAEGQMLDSPWGCALAMNHTASTCKLREKGQLPKREILAGLSTLLAFLFSLLSSFKVRRMVGGKVLFIPPHIQWVQGLLSRPPSPTPLGWGGGMRFVITILSLPSLSSLHSNVKSFVFVVLLAFFIIFMKCGSIFFKRLTSPTCHKDRQ